VITLLLNHFNQMKEYTLSIYTEDQVGLLNRIAAIFTRRKISIESLNSSPTEVPGIYRFTVVIYMEETTIEKVAKQIEKQVDVLKVYFNTEEEIIWQEMGLYKVPTEEIASKVQVERLLRSHGARVVVVRNDYIIFEQTGQRKETEALIKVLEPYGLIEFVRSARIAIIKASSGFHEKLLEFESTSREQETETHHATT